MHYSELDAIKTHLNNIEIKQYGLDCFIVNKPEEKDIIAAKKGLDEMKNIILSGKFDVIIMDELNIALYYKLFDVKEVLDILKKTSSC